MEKKQKNLVLIISISSLLLITAGAIWYFSSNTYEGANEIQRFKNYIEINYQSAAGRKKAIEDRAKNGDPVAQYYLGLCHTQGGLGIAKDYKKAIEWWKKSAENGNTYAQLKLASCYTRGSLGLAKDRKEAAKWYKMAAKECKKSAESGDVKAQYQLANLYTRGRGIKRDYKEAFKWYKKAAENGDTNAQLRLGLCYDTGMLKTPRSSSKAEKWYKKAVEQGNIGALQLLGGVYAKSGDYEKAIVQWEKAVEQRSIWGQFCLMRCYELGLGVPKSDTKAAQYLKKINSRLGRRALGFLGHAYYYGRYSLPHDKSKGKEYLKKAAQNGNKRAARLLKRM